MSGNGKQHDRQMPFSKEAERATLGSVSLMSEVLDDLTPIIRADDFYDDAHQKIFRHMCALHESGRRFDIALLTEQLRKAGDYESIGGAAYLLEIINAVPNAAHATYYAEIVRDHAIRRDMIYATTDILRDGYSARDPVPEFVSRAESSVFNVGNRCHSLAGAVDLKQSVFLALDSMDKRASGKMLRGATSGFHGLDSLTGGFQPGEVTILAGRTSMGKTALALGIMRVVAEAAPVMFFSLEMDSLSIGERMLSMESKCSLYQMRSGTISQETRAEIVEAAANVSALPIAIDDDSGRGISEVASICRRKARRDGLGLVVIDYLQLIQPDNVRDQRHEQVGKISRAIKRIARDQKVPVLCLAQLNRQTTTTKDQRPVLSHLRESGAIEQDADVVVFVHRPWYYTGQAPQGHEKSEPAELIVAKNRQGPTGKVEVLWFGRWMSFANKAPERFAEENRAKRVTAFDEFNEQPHTEETF